MTFERYYQSELSFLRESGAAFGSMHPAIAGMLTERGGDPDVQRLLEGFAFLSARLRQRVDDVTPKLVEALLELAVPQLTRPLPAATIVEFSPPAKAVRGRQVVAAGATLQSRPVQGTPCSFRTSQELTLLPCNVTRDALDDSTPSQPRITLELRLPKGAQGALLHEAGVRLYMHGEYGLCSQLRYWFARYCSGVTLSAGGTRRTLPARHVRCGGEAHALWPWPAFSPRGLLRLLEYFTLPQKFMFVDVLDLAGVELPETELVRMEFTFERPPPLPAAMPPGTFRVNCVPAVNLFRTSADPVRLESVRRPQLLRASGVDPHHMELFSVDSVTGLSASGKRREYPPFIGFRHTAGFYRLSRELSPVDECLDHYIELGTARDDGQSALDARVLSVDLTCTNRNLPSELGEGDVCVATSESPTGVPFANISPVSRPARPPLGERAFHAFLAHLATSHRKLADVGALHALLGSYNLQERSDHPSARVNRARVGAIEHAEHGFATRVIAGAAVRGFAVSLGVRAEGFVSLGDAHLFGTVLDSLFAMQTPLNSFTELSLTLLPGNHTMTWAPRWSA